MPYGRRTTFRRRTYRRPVLRRRSYRRRPSRRSFRRGGYSKRRRLSPGNVYRRSASAVIPRHVTPLPDILYTKFRCEDVWQHNLSTGSVNVYTNFYANNPYDPVVGVSVSACSGFPQLMALYAQCICFASKITLTAQHYSGENTFCYILAMDNNFYRGTTGVTRDFVREAPADVCRSAPLVNQIYNVRPLRMSMYRKVKFIEGVKDLDRSQYCCTGSSGPIRHTYFQVGQIYQSSAPTSSTVSATRIMITYYCKLYDRGNVDA